MEQVNMALVGAIVVLLIIVVYMFTLPLKSTPQSSATTSVLSTTSPSTMPSASTSAPTTMLQTTTVAAQAVYSLKIAANASVGRYLENMTNRTLYLNAQDTPHGNSSVCYGQCAVYWHPYYVSTIVLPSNLSASKFSSFTRTDGAKQLTYMGWPLYTYTSDTNQNQFHGQGVAGTWFTVTYPNLTT